MIDAVVDTNVIVAGVLTGSPRSASRAVIDRLRAGEFRLCLSPATVLEIRDVLMLPRMRSMHRLSHAEIASLCSGLATDCRMFTGTVAVSAATMKDVTDTKWLALALESNAQFLVTSDRRHLQRLRRIGQTRILSPHAFCLELDSRT